MLKEGTDEFLDGITVSFIKETLLQNGMKPNIHIIKDCYNFDEILTILNEN